MYTAKKPGSPEEVLAHFGTKGMKWGVRNENRSGGTSRTKRVARAVGRGADNLAFEFGAKSSSTAHAIATNASEKFVKNDLAHIKARHGEYGKLRNRAKHPFSPEAKAYRADAKKTYLKRLEESANAMTNVQGTRQYTLKESGKPNTSQYFWNVSTQSIKHAKVEVDPVVKTSFTVNPIFDDEGWIVDLKVVEDDMAQTMDRGANFLIHMGFKI